MITKFDLYTESVRSKMTPRSKEEVRTAIDNMPIHQRYNYIIKNNVQDIYTEEELIELKKEYEIVLNELVERFNDKIGGLAKTFVEEFPTNEDYNEELKEKIKKLEKNKK